MKTKTIKYKRKLDGMQMSILLKKTCGCNHIDTHRIEASGLSCKIQHTRVVLVEQKFIRILSDTSYARNPSIRCIARMANTQHTSALKTGYSSYSSQKFIIITIQFSTRSPI